MARCTQSAVALSVQIAQHVICFRDGADAGFEADGHQKQETGWGPETPLC